MKVEIETEDRHECTPCEYKDTKKKKKKGLQGPEELKCALCDYTASKNYTLIKHRIRELGILKYLSIYLRTHSCYAYVQKHDSLVPKPNHDATYAITVFQ